MKPEELRRMAEAAIVCADQMVFVYEKDDGNHETRFVTPISIEPRVGAAAQSGSFAIDDLMILCEQHLPAEGYRKFSMGRMKDAARVISRAF